MAEMDGAIRIETELDDTGFKHGSERMKSAASSLEQSVEQTGRKVQQSTSEMFKGGDSSGLVKQTSAVYNEFQRAEIQLAKAKKALDDYTHTEIPTDDYKRLTSEISKAEAKLLHMYDRRDIMQELGVSESSREWQRLQAQIEGAETALESMEKDAAAMRSSGTAFIDPSTTLRFKELSQSVNEAEAKLQDLRNTAVNGELNRNIENTAETPKKISDAFHGMGEKVKKAVSGVTNTLKKVGSAALNAAKSAAKFTYNLGKAALGKIKSGLSAVAAGFKRIISRSKETGISAKGLVAAFTSLKSMLISKVKRTFVSFLFQQLQTGLQELAKYDRRFDDAVSNMRNRTTELGANIASSFGTLVRTIEPYITRIIDMMSNAMTKVSAMLAKLRGEQTVIVAKKQTASWADSLSDSASAAKKAKTAQEQLNATLSSYDQLHKLNGKESDDGSTGATGDIASEMFETVNTDDVLANMPDFGGEIVKRITTSIRNGNWEDAGDAVADGLNRIVFKIRNSIGKIKPVAKRWATSIAQALNGLTSGLDGGAIGGTPAEGLNLIFETLDAFVSTYKWEDLGSLIGDGLNGLFDGVNWGQVGSTVARGINAVFSTLGGAVHRFNWGKAAMSITAGLNGMIHDIKWSEIGSTLDAAFRHALTAIWDVVGGLDWDSLGTGIGEALQKINLADIINSLSFIIGNTIGGLGTLIDNALTPILESTSWEDIGYWIGNGINYIMGKFDAEKIGTFFANGINAIIGTIKGILETVDFAQAGENTANAINTAVSKVNWEDLGRLVSKAIRGVLTFVKDLVGNTNWYEIGDKVSKMLQEIDWAGIMTDLTETVGAIFGGLGAFFIGLLSDALLELENWWKENAFDENGNFTWIGLMKGAGEAAFDYKHWIDENVKNPFKNGFEKSFEINSPSKVTQEDGEYLAAGIRVGIEEGWKNVDTLLASKADGVREVLAEGWKGVRKDTQSVFNIIKNLMATALSNASEKVTKIMSDIQTTLRRKFAEIKTDTEKQTAGLFSGLTSGASGIGDIQTGVINKLVYLHNDMQKYIEMIRSMVARDFETVGRDLTTGMERGIRDNWDQHVVKALTDLTALLPEPVRRILGIASPSKVFAEIGGFVAAGLGNGIASGEKDVLKTVSGMAKNVTGRMNAEIPGVQVTEKGLVSGLNIAAEKLAAIAKSFTAIKAALQSMGGLMVPQFAAGAVVPPRVRLSAERESTQDSTAVLRALERLIALLERGDGPSGSGGTRLALEVVSKIDRRELARAITEIEISNGRVTNGGRR